MSSRLPQLILILDSRTSQLPLATLMSATNQTAGPSTDNFSAIFNVASAEYQRLTRKSLDTHPLAAQLDTCRNPETISNVLRTQAQAFGKFREDDERLMAWLDPTICILLTFSDALGEGIGLVSDPSNLRMTGFERLIIRHSHLLKLYLPGSVSFSEYVFSPRPLSLFA